MGAILAPVQPTKWLSAPAGWDAAWKAAKAASATVPAWLVALGDSTMVNVASDALVTDTLSKLKTSLASRFTWYGDYWAVTQSADFYTAASATYPAGSAAPWVVPSTNRTWYGWGVTKLPFYASGSAGGPLTFSLPYAVAALGVDLLHYDANAGTWTYRIGAGSPVTVTNTGSHTLKRVAVPGALASGTVLTMTTQSADNVLGLVGIATYASSHGIGLGRFAYPGASAYDYGYSGNNPADKASLWQSGAASVGLAGFPFAPSLVLIGLGINDCQSQYGVLGLRNTLERLCRALRRGSPNCSLLFLVHSNPDPVSSDITSGNFANSKSWGLYATAIADVARVWNGAVANIHAKWGDSGVAQGFQSANQPHPTNAGHADIAALLPI